MGYFDSVRSRAEAPATITPINGEVAEGSEDTAYGLAALRSECEVVRAATKGTRDETLNLAWFRMGRLLDGHLTAATARAELAAAARETGQPEHEIQRALRDGPTGGATAGSKHPREVADLPETATFSEVASIAPRADKDAENGGEGRARTSWWPRPVGERAAEADAQPGPTHLIRDDGQPLLYSGKVNGLIGESESGKSWLAFFAVTQAVNAGQRCLILDFEDSPAGAAGRIESLGLTAGQADLVDYADPDEALGAVQADDLAEALTEGYQVIVVDGVNAAMTLLGLDLNSNTDATRFSTKVLRPLTATGACVITVDHVPKNSEARGKGGIGAQAKRAMTDGCAITVEISEPFGRGQSGKLRLTVDKDRAGHVRGIASNATNPGTAHIESVSDQVRIHISAPLSAEERAEWRPTERMEEISRAIEGLDGPLSKRQIQDLVGGNKDVTDEARKALIDAGNLRVETGPRGALMHYLTDPYRPTVPTVPDCPPTVPGGRSATVPRDPSYYVGGSAGTVSGGAGDGRLSPTGDSPALPDESSCNNCGTTTPDTELDRHDGYCRSCDWQINRK